MNQQIIYLRLAGGLGNQLYQLAAASLLVRHAGVAVKVMPLVEGLAHYEALREPDAINLIIPNDWLISTDASVGRIWRDLAVGMRAGRWLPGVGVSDRNFWRLCGKRMHWPMIMDGYFQSGWTHDSFSAAIQGMNFKQIVPEHGARVCSDEVVVHIRGGDFRLLPRFQIVDAGYYVFAARQSVSRGYKKFAIISDDSDYAESIRVEMYSKVSDIQIRMVECGENAVADFDVIRAASARIIGNSTFAWWAAALGSKSSPTWAPTRATTDSERDYFLNCEIPIDYIRS